MNKILFLISVVILSIVIVTYTVTTKTNTVLRGMWGIVEYHNGGRVIDNGGWVKFTHIGQPQFDTVVYIGNSRHDNIPGSYELITDELDFPTGDYEIFAIDNEGHVDVHKRYNYKGNMIYKVGTLTLSQASAY